MSNFLCIPRGRRQPISDEQLRNRIREIHALCFTNFSKETNLRVRQTKVLRALIRILRDSTRSQLQLVGPHDLVSCAVKILSYFEDLQHRSDRNCDWKRRREHKIARLCYYDLLRSFIPEKPREIVNSLVAIVHKERLWHWEDLCWELARGLLDHGIGGGPMVHGLLDRVEMETTGAYDARAIVRILYEMLESYSWPQTDETILAIERLLKLYYGSLRCGKTKAAAHFAPLRKGLEVCIRHTIKNLSNEHLLVVIYHMCAWSIVENANDATILDFGSTLEYAAYNHETLIYEDTLTEKIFPLLMRMISSSNRLVSLLGNRVIHYLLDRHDNKSQFDTPKIFFESMSFDIRLNHCDKRDKYFLQRNREILHDSLVNGMIKHCSTRLNLESVYCTICLIAVEVPCGFTAAALVCLVMNLQDLTLEQTEMLREVSNHVHATVMAVMSLLCWIHKAKVFYTYVNKIMIQRAQWAPYLNPPLKLRYSYAVHHVLWDKPELFFVDWEARYGLWKCFRLQEDQRRSTEESTKRVRLSELREI